jgi:hypothetical protein
VSFRLLMQDLPAGYAAVARKEGDVLVIVVDQKQIAAAHAQGNHAWGVDLINEVAEAMEVDRGGLYLAV